MKYSWQKIKLIGIDLWVLFKELLVLIFGGTIFIAIGIVGIFYTFFKHIFKLDYKLKNQLQPIIRSTTLLADGFANAGAGELLNDVLKVEGKIKYGKWYQTISAVTGLLQMFVKDTKFRKVLDKLLGKDHCYDAITEQDSYYHRYNY